MLDLLQRMFSKGDTSAKVAKERLRLVVVHDRTSVSPWFMDQLREELIRVISTYMEIDEKSIDVSLDSSDNQVALVASIPVRRMKRVATSG